MVAIIAVLAILGDFRRARDGVCRLNNFLENCRKNVNLQVERIRRSP